MHLIERPRLSSLGLFAVACGTSTSSIPSPAKLWDMRIFPESLSRHRVPTSLKWKKDLSPRVASSSVSDSSWPMSTSRLGSSRRCSPVVPFFATSVTLRPSMIENLLLIAWLYLFLREGRLFPRRPISYSERAFSKNGLL